MIYYFDKNNITDKINILQIFVFSVPFNWHIAFDLSWSQANTLSV